MLSEALYCFHYASTADRRRRHKAARLSGRASVCVSHVRLSVFHHGISWMNGGTSVKLTTIVNSRSTRHWWYWKGHWVKGQGQSEIAIETLWTQQPRITKGISTKTYTNTSNSGVTNWLDFQGHGFKCEGHKNVFWRRHTDGLFAVDLYTVSQKSSHL